MQKFFTAYVVQAKEIRSMQGFIKAIENLLEKDHINIKTIFNKEAFEDLKDSLVT